MKYLVAMMLIISHAHAAPPAPGTEDYNQLMPYAEWMQSLRNDVTGINCCSISDGRTVTIRPKDNHWEAFISKEKFGASAPDEWVPVPEDAIKRIPNPTGFDVAWWYGGKILCFVMASGI